MTRRRRQRTILSDATTPRYDRDGTKTTQTGIDWSERFLDEEYVRGLRGDFDEVEYYDGDDREWDDER